MLDELKELVETRREYLARRFEIKEESRAEGMDQGHSGQDYRSYPPQGDRDGAVRPRALRRGAQVRLRERLRESFSVELCAKELSGSGILVCTVIGFPLGANAPETKAAEARLAVSQGAREIDMVDQPRRGQAGGLEGRRGETSAAS